MLLMVVAGIVMLAFLDRAMRTGRLDLLKLRFRFDLFALRDELRAAVIAGKVPKDNWFEYLDTTITKAIDHIDGANMYEMFALVVGHLHDREILEAYSKFLVTIQEERNAELLRIYSKYIALHVRFLGKRHRAVKKLFLQTDRSLKAVKRVLTSSPERSTLLRYCS